MLQDAFADVTGIREQFTELTLSDGSTEKTSFYTNSPRSLQLYDASVTSYFLKTFGRNQREITCECERSNQPSLVQALHLSNGSTVNDKLSAPAGRLARLLREEADADRLITEAYSVALSRAPREAERKAYLQLFQEAGPAQRTSVAEDLFWSILTSREFLFQH